MDGGRADRPRPSDHVRVDGLERARIGQCYAMHAGRDRGIVELADVKLALHAKDRSGFCQVPGREVVTELAKSRNKLPLPELNRAPGLRLPRDPPHSTLLTPNYEAFPKKAKVEKTERPQEG